MSITRVWKAAREKVDAEGRCRVCGYPRNLESAHVLGCEHDAFTLERVKRTSKTYHVEKDRILPLCGPYPHGCHGKQHRHELNLLPYLTAAEQAQAVRDAGSIESARTALIGANHGQTV